MNEHKRVWRTTILVLLLVVIIGPWTFDKIFVPSKYACSTPFVRLKSDYCGMPMSGIQVLSMMAGGFTNIVVGMATGTTVLKDRLGEFVFCLLGILLILPYFSTLFMILREESRGGFVFHVAALSLAFGASLLLAMISYPELFWRLWGIWLYVGVAASALIIEGIMLVARRK
jgi:hypothetical protein